MPQSVWPMRARAPALALMLLLSACAGTTGSTKPSTGSRSGSCDLLPLVDYTPEQRARLADEVEATPSGSMTREAFADYVALRALIRSCQGR